MKRLLLLLIICISSVSFGQVPSYVPTNGLVGWWPFNGNANDESVNGNNGTVNGPVLTNDRFGNPNSAYDFDGLNDIITIGDLDVIDSVQQASFALWFTTKKYSRQRIIGKVCAGDPAPRTSILVDNYNGNFRNIRYNLMTDMGAGFASVVTQNNFINQDSLYHLVIVFDGTQLTNEEKCRFYVNNLQVMNYCENPNTNTPTSVPDFTPLNQSDITFGAMPTCAANVGDYFEGLIDDIGIWNRALTECEIQDLYNAGVNSIASVTQTDVTLTADQNNATYQWIDCDNNNAPISGETNQSYTPTVTGNYAVEVTVNGCTSVSECVLVDFTGVDELLNPTMKKLVKIVNLLGQEVEYTPNTVLIYIYSDGTSEKVVTIED